MECAAIRRERTVWRLVQHENPEARETPVLLLADLRAFDELIELVYAGDQLWWIGRVSPSDALRDRGWLMERQMRAAIDENPELRHSASIQRNILLARLVAQGFSRILQVRSPGDVSGTVLVEWIDPEGHGTVDEYETTVVREIQERYFHFNNDGGAAFVAKRLALTDGTARQQLSDAAFENYLKNDGLAYYKREFRNRVQFGYGGTTGVRDDATSGGLITLATR